MQRMDFHEKIERLGFAFLFAGIGLIVGMWFAASFYEVVLARLSIGKSPVAVFSLLLILTIIVASAIVGYRKGRYLFES